MQFRKTEQSDEDRLTDMVYVAMETGNTARAREVLAEHRETYPQTVKNLRADVQRQYGIYL